MAILQAGIHKSGNFWLSRILRQITHHAAWEHSSYIQRHPIHPTALTWELSYAGQADMDFLNIEPQGCYCRISGVFREPIDDIGAYVRQCTHVWSHSPINARSLEVLPLFDKIVYIVRDPRDMAVSLSRFVFTRHVRENYTPHYEKDPESFLGHALDGELRDWVRHVGGYLRVRPIIPFHVVFYERLLHAFDSELNSLLTYLEIDLSAEAIDAIRHEMSFDTMHRKDPDHVRRGQSRQWARILSDEEKRHALDIAGDLLELLDYPTTANPELDDDGGDGLPRLPETIDPERLERAIGRAERGPWGEIRRFAGFLLSDRSLRVKADRVRRWTGEVLGGRSAR